MTAKVELSRQTGPIRIRVSGTERVRVRVSSLPVTVRVLGTPGPTGATGAVGPQGLQGPPGNLDAGITIDGGNF